MLRTNESTPDEAVADVIVAKFREGGLLTERQLTGLATRLAAGTVTATEWGTYAAQVADAEGATVDVEVGPENGN
jgi:hypothetical protein